MVALQKAYVRKVIDTVNDLDNVISYRDLMNPAPIEKLSRVGKACMLLGLSRKADRDKALRENRAADAEKLKAEAIKFYEASFSLGYKLCAERVRWPEFDAGWTLMISSAIGMERLDPSRAPAKAFADACTRYYADQIKPLAAEVEIPEGTVGRHANGKFACEVCGAEFESADEVTSHYIEAHAS